MNEWQPIEAAPKDGTEFVGYWEFAITDGVPQWMAGRAWWDDGRFRFESLKHGPPTHWTPAPKR